MWDDVFEDDQEALEEAVKAIEEGLDREGDKQSLVELELIEALIASGSSRRARDDEVRGTGRLGGGGDGSAARPAARVARALAP